MGRYRIRRLPRRLMKRPKHSTQAGNGGAVEMAAGMAVVTLAIVGLATLLVA